MNLWLLISWPILLGAVSFFGAYFGTTWAYRRRNGR